MPGRGRTQSWNQPQPGLSSGSTYIAAGMNRSAGRPGSVPAKPAGETPITSKDWGNVFGVFGLQPALGRLFGPSDDRTPGGHPSRTAG